MKPQETEILDLQSIKIEKKLSALIVDEKNNQIEEFTFLIRMNREEMKEIRAKHGVTRTQFFKIPGQDGIRYFKLRTQNFLMESTINTISAFTKKIRGQE